MMVCVMIFIYLLVAVLGYLTWRVMRYFFIYFLKGMLVVVFGFSFLGVGVVCRFSLWYLMKSLFFCVLSFYSCSLLVHRVNLILLELSDFTLYKNFYHCFHQKKMVDLCWLLHFEVQMAYHLPFWCVVHFFLEKDELPYFIHQKVIYLLLSYCSIHQLDFQDDDDNLDMIIECVGIWHPC